MIRLFFGRWGPTLTIKRDMNGKTKIVDFALFQMGGITGKKMMGEVLEKLDSQDVFPGIFGLWITGGCTRVILTVSKINILGIHFI